MTDQADQDSWTGFVTFGDTTWGLRPATWSDSAGWHFPAVPPVSGGDGTDGDSDADKDGDGTDTDKSGGTDTDKSGEDNKDDKKFTQEEVNALVTREVQKATRGKLSPKDLGFESQKDLSEFVQAMKNKANEDKTEQEKQLEEAISQAKEEAKGEVLSVANERLTKAEFLIAAHSHNVKYAEDAFVVAKSMPELWQGVEIDDKGKVVGFDDAFFDDLKEAKEYLFGEPAADDHGDIGAGAKGGKTGASREQELKERYSALR